MEPVGPVKELPSEIAIKSVVERELLCMILEALFTAEWEHRGHMLHGAEAKIRTLQIRTSLGRLRIRVPKGHQTSSPFRSSLVERKRNRLKVHSSRILALPFTEDAELGRTLEEMYHEAFNDNFVNSFGKHLTTRLQARQDEALFRDWSALYLGTLGLTPPKGSSAAFELDYCIGYSAATEFHVVGLWDPKNHSPSRWEDIKEELKTRGLRRAKNIYTDNSTGLADTFLELISPEMAISKSNDTRDVIGRTILLTKIISESPEANDIPFIPPISAIPHSQHRSVLSLTFSCAALGLLVLFGGFYQSARVSAISSAPSAAVSVSNPQREAAVQVTMTSIEKQLLSELANTNARSERLAPLVRIAAASNSPQITGALVKLGSHPDSTVRISIAKAFTSSGETLPIERKEALVRLLNDPDFLVRGFAAKALARVGTAEAKQALKERLAIEEDEVVRKLLERLVK